MSTYMVDATILVFLYVKGVLTYRLWRTAFLMRLDGKIRESGMEVTTESRDRRWSLQKLSCFYSSFCTYVLVTWFMFIAGHLWYPRNVDDGEGWNHGRCGPRGSYVVQLWCMCMIMYRCLTPDTVGWAAPCGLQGCKNWPALFPGRMSYKATKPGLVSVLYLSMHYMVLLFIRAPFYVLLVFIYAVFWLFWLSSCQVLG